ncbi:MAG: hypothetical protein JW882_09840 [Deltaproteobacteria bacterium]|nr:hypothetical protein [Deltaproteobacteria bacterium]
MAKKERPAKLTFRTTEAKTVVMDKEGNIVKEDNNADRTSADSGKA